MTDHPNRENPTDTTRWETAKAPRHRDPRDEAADQIQAVRDYWAPTTPPPAVIVDGLATATLRRLIDQRTMEGGQP